jgi:hypothetical protein
MIQTDEQLLIAQQSLTNLAKVLLEARKVHSAADYSRMSQPILLEMKQREQEIIEYLSAATEERIAS